MKICLFLFFIAALFVREAAAETTPRRTPPVAAKLIRTSDHAIISAYHEKNRVSIRILDRSWINRVADILTSTAYTPATSHIFAIGPSISFLDDHEREILNVSVVPGQLSIDSEYEVPATTVKGITELIKEEIQANQSPQPTAPSRRG